MLKHFYKKHLAQASIALLIASMLITGLGWGMTATAHADSSILTLNVKPYMLPFTVYEAGVALDNVVATGTDALGPGDPITATIDWGDKTTPTQQTFIDDRTFQISGAHAYSKIGKYTITVTAAIPALQQSVTGTGTINVVPAYTLNVATIHPDAGQAWNGTIATGTDPFPNDSLIVTINWGDRSAATSLKTTSSTSGNFQVNSTHTYSYAAGWTITVSVTSILVGPISATNTVTVGAGVTITIPLIKATAGTSWSGTVATGTDIVRQDPLNVSIDWGDGTTPSTQYITTSDTGAYQVGGTHTYTKAGTYTITVSILSLSIGAAANPQTGTATVTAAIPALTLHAQNITARARHQFRNTIATVTGTISAQGLNVTINWGDGTTSTLRLAKGQGTFNINDSHTYRKRGIYTVTINVQDNGTGQRASATASATIR